MKTLLAGQNWVNKPNMYVLKFNELKLSLTFHEH